MDIKIVHKGEDYYGVQLDGEYVEVNISSGATLKHLIKAIESLMGYWRK